MIWTTYNILNSSISTSTKGNNTDDEGEDGAQAEKQVFLLEPLALAEQNEPHNTRNPERETGHEESRGKRKQVGEDGDSLSNNPSDDGEDGCEGDPADPAHGSVDISKDGVLEHTSMEISERNG